MKCLNCGQENKDAAKVCKKCSRDISVPPAWFPDIRWHMKTLGIIYACLIVFYFGVSYALRQLPKPYYVRKIAPEMTPWLKRKGIPKFVPEGQLTIPQTQQQP